MASIPSYPPIVHHPHSSRPVSVSTAHDVLATFLHLANLDPAYRPDSTLTERGPQSNSSVGNPNLTLHHLDRIKLGLEGTNLGVDDLDAESFGQRNKNRDTTAALDSGERRKKKWQDRDADVALSTIQTARVVPMAAENDEVTVTAQDTDARGATNGGEGWQDREDYELAQDDEDVDVNDGERDLAGVDSEEIRAEILETEMGRMTQVDEELDGVGEAEIIRTGNAIDEQQWKRKSALTQEGRNERRRLKRVREKQQKKTVNQTKSKEKHFIPSKPAADTDGHEVSEETVRPKKKDRSRTAK